MTGAPEDVLAMAEQRERARRNRDFGRADDLRRRIFEAGFEVADTPSGPQLSPRSTGTGPAGEATYARSEDVPSLLLEPPSFDATVQWIVQGWPEDVERGIEACARSSGRWRLQHVVVQLTHDRPPTAAVDLIRMSEGVGWATARNAGLRRALGNVVVLADGSVEPTADVVGPLMDALKDATVGVTGPFGIVTDDLREFRESPGPDVDAVEGYLMAFRRELLQGGLAFDEKFKFYRTADIELSFQIKAMGLRATVTPLELHRHEHRVWASTPEDERTRLSKRNFYRFLDRWRGRTDLLVSGGR